MDTICIYKKYAYFKEKWRKPGHPDCLACGQFQAGSRTDGMAWPSLPLPDHIPTIFSTGANLAVGQGPNQL